MSHSPGPWVVKNTFSGKLFIENENRYIADVHEWFVDENKPESEANARLIASAPEMLEALEAVEAIDDDISQYAAHRLVSEVLSKIYGAQ